MNVRFDNVADMQIVVAREVNKHFDVARRIDDGGVAGLFVADDVRCDRQPWDKALVQ